jgi:hypothetical protein
MTVQCTGTRLFEQPMASRGFPSSTWHTTDTILLKPHGYAADANELNIDSTLEYLLRDKQGITLDTPYGGSLVVHEDGHSYNYSYGPSGIPGLVRNRYAVACAAFAGIGGISFGYDQGVIANVLVMKDFLAHWPIGPWEKGLMSALNRDLV